LNKLSSNVSDTDLSELERELELEFENSTIRDEGSQEFELEPEPEASRDEGSQEFELELEKDDKIEAFATKLHELSGRTYESEFEENSAIDNLLNEMQREYFSFGSVFKKLTNAGKGLLKKVAPKILGKVPIWGDVYKAATALASGNFKDLVKQMAKAGIQAYLPGVGTAATTAANALGFEVGQEDINNEAWKRFVLVNKEGYDYLARNLTPKADEPAEASRLASNAFRYALQKYTIPQRSTRGPTRTVLPMRRKKKYTVIRIKPGQTLVIKCRNF